MDNSIFFIGDKKIKKFLTITYLGDMMHVVLNDLDIRIKHSNIFGE